MGNYAPVYSNGQRPFTATAGAAVTGGQIVAWSGASTVSPAGAASTVVAGVAAHDCANGGKVSVWPLEGLIHEVSSTGAISAGGGVDAGAAGVAAASASSLAASSAAGTLIGTAVTTAASNKVRFQGRR